MCPATASPKPHTTPLRMIPYGLYVLSAASPGGSIIASTVSWLSQSSFEPPLLIVAIKADSRTYATVKAAQYFAINFLRNDQKDIATRFFKHHQAEGGSIGGYRFTLSPCGTPLLDAAHASLLCTLQQSVASGDHVLCIGAIQSAQQSALASQHAGRPDDLTLRVRDLGPQVFYGG